MQFARLATLRGGLTMIALVLAQSGARGNMILPPQIRTIAPLDTNWATDTTPGASYTPFDKFSSPFAGDALKTVTINVSYVVESPYSVTFTTAADFLFHTFAALSIYLPNGTPIVNEVALFNQLLNLSGTTGQTIADPNRMVSGSLAPIVLTSLTDLALFSGPGTIYLPIVAGAYTGNSETSGNVNRFVQTRVGVTLDIQYEFVPEPSSYILMGLGGSGLLLFTGLRKRVKGGRLLTST